MRLDGYELCASYRFSVVEVRSVMRPPADPFMTLVFNPRYSGYHVTMWIWGFDDLEEARHTLRLYRMLESALKEMVNGTNNEQLKNR